MIVTLGLVLAALLQALARRDRAEPALRWWAAGQLVLTAAMLLIGLRGIAPNLVTIDFANALLILAFGLVWGGARRFAGAPAPPARILAGSLAWLLACQIPALYASLPARIATIAALTTALLLAIGDAFRRGMRQDRLPSHRAMLLVVGGLALLQLLRGLGAVALPMHSSGMARPDADWENILAILSVALQAGMGVLMVALGLERGERRNAAALTAARDAEATARAAAEAANRAKSLYLARMSHELRTPLNGVLGLAEALAREPGLPPGQRDHAQTLERAGLHLLAIVNGVLDLEQVASGRLVLEPAPVRLAAVLEEALELMRPAAEARRLNLRLDLVPGLPEAMMPKGALPEGVLVDAVRLRQVLLNLLSNAVKFTPQGGSVVLLATAPAPGLLHLTVTDTGPGIPDSQRATLFEEFAKGTQAEAGSGLGLAISAALAVAMGGRLAHEPGPGGCGSRFVVTLPLSAAEPPPLPAAAPGTAVPGRAPPGPGRPLRLLVVDDAPVNRAVVRALLRPEGHDIDEAADGAAAIAALVARPAPDVVLMDLHMPGMDGFAATRAIRALHGPAARVPVIALTGDAMPEAAAAGRAAGMDGHLVKPLRRATLLAELARVLPAG